MRRKKLFAELRALHQELDVLRAENARLRLQRQVIPSVGAAPERSRAVAGEVGNREDEQDEAVTDLANAAMMRASVLSVCQELQITFAQLQERLQAGVPQAEQDRRVTDRRSVARVHAPVPPDGCGCGDGDAHDDRLPAPGSPARRSTTAEQRSAASPDHPPSTGNGPSADGWTTDAHSLDEYYGIRDYIGDLFGLRNNRADRHDVTGPGESAPDPAPNGDRRAANGHPRGDGDSGAQHDATGSNGRGRQPGEAGADVGSSGRALRRADVG